MRRRWQPVVFALSVVLGIACTKRNPAFGDETGTTGATANTTIAETGVPTTETTAVPTTGADTSTATSEPVLDTSDTSSTSTGPEGTSTGLVTTSTTDTTDATTGTDWPASCAEARDLNDPKSGPVTLALPQGGGHIDVWCEQLIAGGGWLLVARSTEGGLAPFGWGVDTGMLDNNDIPYSLDLLTNTFPVGELLVGMYVQDKELSAYAYLLAVPPDFPSGYKTTAAMTSYGGSVLGACLAGPTMLEWIGFTDLEDRFRFRDSADAVGDVYGLYADGFKLNGSDCSASGKLPMAQSMIFVR